MKNFHFQNGKCDQLLATDIVKQLQNEIHFNDEEKNGIYWETKGWERNWYSKCWFKQIEVTIANDTFKVIALRSYDTIVGFVYNGYIYEVGKYSKTTSIQFSRYFKCEFIDCMYQYYDKAY